MAFNALWLTDPKTDTDPANIVQVDETTLPHLPVTLRVLYSSLNYKDALAIRAKAPVIRQFPLIPGIDMIGEVIASESIQWPIGKLAIVTGWGIGEQYHGGLAEKFTAKAEWLTALPEGITPTDAALIGTAGLTAMLAVLQLEQQGITPEKGPIAVSGASGGVGSFSTWILAKLGYEVIAISGDRHAEEYLVQTLGASSILPRSELSESGRKLQPERWVGAIDCVGSHTLANLLAATQRNGCVVACGMAQGLELTTSVAPFILRSIRLVGVDSVYCEVAQRNAAWQRFATLLSHSSLPIPYQTIGLQQAIEFAGRLLEGDIRGRIVVQTTFN
ncbi:acrylyl-CoA reductase (NADPH) [Rosenbergiella nectarea]|uniref:Acrylyl-CoA reductase (NADPH) n=1 Tax=Rosenbergiella nectarea TaxID=988801 RepID=A0A1H9FDZ6_9GAMM|nr:MDR family oxidoreductase [Rosenbergiella nectarea]SEQ36161.1 acrylyl-CoA reductase (NADPH) [Rosenbergiella nectarea]